MAYSTQRATSDGTLVLLDVAIPYFDRSEIAVLYDGVLQNTGWSWVGSADKKISFSPAVPNGVEVMLVRTTDLSEPRHIFTLGAKFTTESLDEDIRQILHIAQEARENATIEEVFHDLNMHGYKIVNQGPGVLGNDTPNMGQLAAHLVAMAAEKDAANGFAGAAATSAAEAGVSASTAANAVIVQVNTGSTNAVLRTSSTGAARLPAGTTAQRDTVPVVGDTRLNTSTGALETWNGSLWVAGAGGATGAGGDKVFYENSQVVTASYTISEGKNAMSAGNITIADGVIVNVPDGAIWSIV